ncbi:flavin reductase [Roseomonas sp. NAR14]|uniref:Flavin reductase n=1 Tax=Roseomonas acroporae TaxID=2937791 RepID=A0A9X1YC01_9PROT|nr:flavin reductase [Roseomonas acroporae]MCK8787353.1 flavin reductase [Roseomonas acroporae]
MGKMIDAAAFRNAMAQLGAAVNVVTTDGPSGLAGVTASAVCSVTDAPPTLLVCINRGSSAHPVFERNGVLCVNTLAAHQDGISDHFAGRSGLSGAKRFEGIDWQRLLTGAPVLAGAGAAFDARIVKRVEHGTHSVFFAEVLAISPSAPDTGGLIYYGRRYHPVGHLRRQQPKMA